MKKLLTLLCLCCLCIGSAWGEDYEKVLTLDCASASSNGSKDVYGVAATTSMNVEGIASFLNNAANIESGITVSDYSGSVYWTKGSGGSGIPDNVLKVGTASGTGKFCFTISNNYDNISKVVVVGYGWKNTSKLSVNSSATQSPTTAATETSFTFILPTATKAINLNVTTSAICITKIELYKEISSTKTLESIEISGAPTKTEYTEGETFDPAGLVVTGTYDDESEGTITEGIEWTVTPSPLTAGTTSVSVTATVGDITSEPYVVNGLTVTAAPLKVSFSGADGSDVEFVTGSSSANGAIWAGAPCAKGIITLTGNVTSGSNYSYYDGSVVRFYTNNNIVLTPASGYKITKVEIVRQSTTGSNSGTINCTGLTADTNNETTNTNIYTGSTTGAVTFTATAQVRFTSIVVYYEEAGGVVAIPTITPSVEADAYFEPFTITLASATEGASIYYTTNGDEPTDASTLYESPINISETTTIKAIAVKEGLENSEVAAKTFTFGPVFNSLEDLVAADITSGTTVKVSFENVPIKSIFVTQQGDRSGIYFDIQKGGKDIEIYYQNVPADWVSGGTISGTITCPWKVYNGTWELAPEQNSWTWTNLNYTAPSPEDIYSIIIDQNIQNGVVSVNGEIGQAVEGTIITLSASPAEHYHFYSWKVYKTGGESTTIAVEDNQFTMPAYNVTVSATFAEDDKYTVTFSEGEESFENYAGTQITLPVRSGKTPYSFVGWSETQIEEEQETSPATYTGTYKITKTVCLYPVYVRTEGGGLKEVTASVSIEDYATANEWVNSTQYTTVNLDENISITSNDEGNTAKYYSSDNTWRMYQNSNSSWQVMSVDNAELISVKFTYKSSNKGILTYNGDTYDSDDEIALSGCESGEFTIAYTGTDNKNNGQVLISAIEVKYTIGSGTNYYVSVLPDVVLSTALNADDGLYYATYYATQNMKVDGYSAINICKVNGDDADLMEMENSDVIPASAAVVLTSLHEYIELTVTTETSEYEEFYSDPDLNDLVGYAEDTQITGSDEVSYYALNYKTNPNGGKQVGFFAPKGAGNPNGSFTAKANKAYLKLDGQVQVKAFYTFGGKDVDVDAINSINADKKQMNGAIYNLNGQRLNSLQKGINIVNGKKVYVK